MAVSLKATKQAIYKQWQDMINNGRVPVMEARLSNGECLECWINYQKGNDYISFSFDEMEFKTWFSGQVKKRDSEYTIKLDMYFDSLDHYLQEIYQEMAEGFIYPNNIKLAGDE